MIKTIFEPFIGMFRIVKDLWPAVGTALSIVLIELVVIALLVYYLYTVIHGM